MTKEIYVSPEGRDDQPGTKDAPFRTVGRAQGEVRAAIRGGLRSETTVYIRGGLYELESPLRFDGRDSGGDGSPVRYCAYPGETPVLVGGKQLTGWEPYRDGIWRARTEPGLRFHTLYADGRRVSQARLPAAGYFETDAAEEALLNEETNRHGIRYREGDLPVDGDMTDATVFVWPGEGEWNWFSETKTVSSVDRANRRLTFATPATWSIGEGSRYYVQGSLQFLQAPGQYYQDAANGWLYYRPLSDDADPNGQSIVAPRLKRLLEIGDKDALGPAEHLVFSGLTLACTDFFEEYRMMDDNAERSEHREGLVYVNHAKHVRIEHCRLLMSGSCGIFLDAYASGIEIHRNDISRLGYIGISLNGFPPGKGPFRSAEESYTNRGHRITHNVIEDGGELIGHGCGIFLYQSGDNDISRNRITRMPRYGFSLKGMRYGTMPKEAYGISVTWDNHWDFLHSRNNRIACNDISAVMEDSQDGGMIEAWGPGRGNVIHANHLHDSGIHFSFGFGIYLDDAADDFTVTCNVIRRLYSTGQGKLWMLIFSKGIGNRIVGNLLVDNPHAISAIGSQEMAGEANKGIEISGNIVYNSGYLYYFVNYDNERFASADRNLYWRDGAPCLVAGELPLTPSGDDELDRHIYSLDAWRSLEYGKYDAATIVADPQFRTSGAFEYELRPHSPAYALGFKDIDFESIGPGR
ncbi:right-handed parallel beta-helix repeat-containing protein [Paenibacillus soyae]|uniref:Right-handed parallel beta-helix repeat-containing protein n=1 Tax=Paenibacillus soyae TaxID=2969249 RepID=A0A9X2MV46_9BACL|nr:right-handed parallel beta-helix repeat-containing protein [Paenibacillus soyae]MCR2806431.1 right-handed parallel beta-helix repeat-containing protein [Paenibacillus soyae]